MLHSDYEHLVLYRQKRQDLENSASQLRFASARRRGAGRRPVRTLAHGLGAALVAAGRTLQSL